MDLQATKDIEEASVFIRIFMSAIKKDKFECAVDRVKAKRGKFKCGNQYVNRKSGKRDENNAEKIFSFTVLPINAVILIVKEKCASQCFSDEYKYHWLPTSEIFSIAFFGCFLNALQVTTTIKIWEKR